MDDIDQTIEQLKADLTEYKQFSQASAHKVVPDLADLLINLKYKVNIITRINSIKEAVDKVAFDNIDQVLNAALERIEQPGRV